MRIPIERCAAVVVDVQERLLPHMFNHAEVTKNIVTLIQGLQALDVPLLLTEQYPKGLGRTIGTILNLIQTPPISKISFSCVDEPAFSEALAGLKREAVIVAGIETHVCVMQTAIDLKKLGYTPIVVADCVSSRRKLDHEIALKRYQAEGVILSTYESILLELCRRAGTEEFRTISRLIK